MKTKKEQAAETEQKLVNALVKVGQKKPLAKITVSDLSHASGINRGTFYLHYLDKDDMINQLCSNLTQKFKMTIELNMEQTMDPNFFKKGIPYPLVDKIINFASENRILLKFLFGINGTPYLLNEFSNILAKNIQKRLIQVKGNASFKGIPNNYAINLIINTIMTTVKTWINDDSKQVNPNAAKKIIMKTLYMSPYDLLGIEK